MKSLWNVHLSGPVVLLWTAPRRMWLVQTSFCSSHLQIPWGIQLGPAEQSSDPHTVPTSDQDIGPLQSQTTRSTLQLNSLGSVLSRENVHSELHEASKDACRKDVGRKWVSSEQAGQLGCGVILFLRRKISARSRIGLGWPRVRCNSRPCQPGEGAVCLVCCRIHSHLLFYPSLDKFLSVLVLSGFVMVIQLPRLMLVFYKLVYVQWENSMALMWAPGQPLTTQKPNCLCLSTGRCQGLHF